MRGAARFAAVHALLLMAGCGHEEVRAPVVDRHDVPDLPARAGTAKDFGIVVTSVLQRNTPSGVDARFEVRNQGRSIVKFEVVDGDPGPEVVLAVEVYRLGAWERVATQKKRPIRLDDLWPEATHYARALVPLEARFARVVARAQGLVNTKSGATLKDLTEISSDAFELGSSK